MKLRLDLRQGLTLQVKKKKKTALRQKKNHGVNLKYNFFRSRHEKKN